VVSAQRFKDLWSLRMAPRTAKRLVLLSSLVGFVSGLPAQDASFRRGDANADGAFNIADILYIVNLIFLGAPSAGCDDAADVNDDGIINITDPIFAVGYLFLGESEPPPPFRECGRDPSPDAFTCAAFAPCPVASELCLDQELLDGLLGTAIGFGFCLPAGVLEFPLDRITVAVCPESAAPPCGVAQAPGCPVELTSVSGWVDVEGARVGLRFEGRVDDLPVQVSESLFNTSTTCLTDFHGASPSQPFRFDAVIPLIVEEVAPGVFEVTGAGEGSLENVDMAMSVSGGLLCQLFQAAQGAFIPLLLEPLEALTRSAAENLGGSLVGLRLCR
jgi:hypothetical protein